MLTARPTSSSSIKRVHTNTSSNVEVFYSATEDSNPKRSSLPQPNRQKTQRKDSGYSEGPRRPVFNAENGALDFLSLQLSLDEVARLANKKSARQKDVRKHRSSTISGQRKQRTEKARAESVSVPVMTRSSTKTQSSSSASPTSSVHRRPRGLSRTTSIHSPISAQDPYLVHQKARDIVQALGTSEHAVSSTETSRPPSFRQYQSTEYLPGFYNERPSAMTSMVELDTELETTISPLYTATNIDWTDPYSRKDAYEKHDQGKRGVRGLLKKITPRKWQSDQIQFYDGDSDAGSVRRYRLDLDER